MDIDVKTASAMNETLRTILERRSIRRFDSERLVEEEKLQAVLLAGCYAPTAGNAQPWKVIVVRNASLRQQLAKAALGQSFVAEAPVVLAVCGDMDVAWRSYQQRGVQLYVIQDTAAMAENMLLAAHSLGLGGCWVGAFREEEVRRLLGLTENLRPLCLLPLGYPRGTARTVPKKPLDAIVDWRD